MSAEFETVNSVEQAKEMLGQVDTYGPWLEYEVTGSSSIADGKIDIVRPNAGDVDLAVIPWWGPSYTINEDLAAEELVGHKARLVDIEGGDVR